MRRRLVVWSLIMLFMLSINSIIYSQKKKTELTKKQQDIKKLLVLTGSDKIAIQIIDQMIGTFKITMSQVPDEYWKRVKKKFDAGTLVELVIPIYEKHLTHDDIKGLIKFYQSPVGKKLVSVTPDITRESYTVGEKWGRQIAEEIMTELKEEEFSEKENEIKEKEQED